MHTLGSGHALCGMAFYIIVVVDMFLRTLSQCQALHRLAVDHLSRVLVVGVTRALVVMHRLFLHRSREAYLHHSLQTSGAHHGA